MYANIIKFVDDETQNAFKRSSTEQTVIFEAFAYKTWGSKLKPMWIPVMIRHGLFTELQMTEIDSKTKSWSAGMKPIEDSTLSYLLIGALVIAVAGNNCKNDKAVTDLPEPLSPINAVILPLDI